MMVGADSGRVPLCEHSEENLARMGSRVHIIRLPHGSNRVLLEKSQASDCRHAERYERPASHRGRPEVF
jgi:hypothetical protein